MWIDQDTREAPSWINSTGFRFWTLSDLFWQLHVCSSNFQVAKCINLEDEVQVLVAQLCLTLYDPMDCSPPRLLCPWDSPGKNTGEGSHSFLQRIFPTQGLKGVSCIAGRIFTFWATREAQSLRNHSFNGTECSIWFHICIKSKMWTMSQKTSLLTRSVLLESLLPVLAKWLSVYHWIQGQRTFWIRSIFIQALLESFHVLLNICIWHNFNFEFNAGFSKTIKFFKILETTYTSGKWC